MAELTAGQQFGVNAGSTAAAALVNGGFGILNSWLSNKWAAQRAEKDREANYLLGEKQAENADKRTRALYNDLYSIPAQMQQLKEAGLSPSIYASGGVNGISGQGGAMGNSAGVKSDTFGIPGLNVSPIDMSQIELNKAQARNLNAEADEKEGLNPMGEAKIANIVQQTATSLSQQGLNEAAKELTDAQRYGKLLENQLAETTFEDNAAYISYLAKEQEAKSSKALYEAGNEKIKFEINTDTQKQQKQQIINSTIEQLRRIANIKADTALKNKQWKQIEEAIYQKWDELEYQSWNAVNYGEYVKNQKEFWKGLLGNYIKGLEVQKRGQDISMFNTLIDAGTSVINSGMNTYGTIRMADTYQQVGGKPTTTVKTNFNQYGRATGYQKTVTTH